MAKKLTKPLDAEELPYLTNGKIAKMLEKYQEIHNESSKGIFNLALNGQERFNEIIARLGDDHPAVVRYNHTREELQKLEIEGMLRVGNTYSVYTTITYLKSSKFLRKPRKKRGESY